MDTNLPLALAKISEGLELLQQAQNGKEVKQNTKPDASMKLIEQHFSSMQTKLDKVVRQLDALAENQKKMSKVLQSLVKNKRSISDENDTDNQPPAKKTKVDEVSVVQEESWAKDLLLIGDGHWQKLKEVEDIAVQIGLFQKQHNFFLNARVEENIQGLYDRSVKEPLFPIPPSVKKVAISVGSQDLFSPNLKTLKDASMKEVRISNEKILKEKSSAVNELIQCLLNQNKTVVFLLPPIGEERLEVFKHWEELIIKETSSIAANSKFKLINLPSVM